MGELSVSQVNAAISDAFRDSYALVLSNLAGRLRDIDLAEEAIQEAFAAAMRSWPGTGVPANPGGWIATVAHRRAIDRIRREKNYRHKTELLASLERVEAERPRVPFLPTAIQDDRLQMLFACCHPSLATDKQVALTLRTLGGLTTREIAEAFLVSEPTMAQRIVRAKSKIRDAGIPFTVPGPEDLSSRVDAVLAVVYLIFNEGYLASSGDDVIRVDLAESAIDLGRLLVELLPHEDEVRALLALMLLQHARRHARTDEDGNLILLEDQDRGAWDRPLIDEGLQLMGALSSPSGPYALQAEIAACHAAAAEWEDTDWDLIVSLYDRLVPITGSPVVALNRAVAVGLARGPESGLEALVDVDLDGYRAFHSSKGELLRRAGKHDLARFELQRALELSSNPAERRLVQSRIESLEPVS